MPKTREEALVQGFTETQINCHEAITKIGHPARLHAFYNDHAPKVSGGNTLFIIDPQNDFHPGGSLAIESANEDAKRIADLIDNNCDKIDNIVVSLDTHQGLHIAHPLFWANDAGESPDPFTVISHEDYLNGAWKPRDPKFKDWCHHYTKTLESEREFKLCIWPPHCLIGTNGHAVVPVIDNSLQNWMKTRCRAVDYVIKGNHALTEHYSALRAEVIIDSDPRTNLNKALVDDLYAADRVIICGQAKSHCVNFTTRDLLKCAKDEKDITKVVLLSDCCSSVQTFEKDGATFEKDVKDLGVTVCTVADLSL